MATVPKTENQNVALHAFPHSRSSRWNTQAANLVIAEAVSIGNK